MRIWKVQSIFYSGIGQEVVEEHYFTDKKEAEKLVDTCWYTGAFNVFMFEEEVKKGPPRTCATCVHWYKPTCTCAKLSRNTCYHEPNTQSMTQDSLTVFVMCEDDSDLEVVITTHAGFSCSHYKEE